MASMKDPIYSAQLIKPNKRYKLKKVTLDLVLSYGKDDLAAKVKINLANVKVGNKRLTDIIEVMDGIIVYANTGSGSKEVFRGFVWERDSDTKSDSYEIKLTCYDKLIYLQKSKDNLYVAKGGTTSNVITSLANKWGIKIKYTYGSITFDKNKVFRSDYISDIIIELLNETKKKIGDEWVIRFENDVMVIEKKGINTTIYRIENKKNLIYANVNETMDGMINQVKIIKAEESNNENDEEDRRYNTVKIIKGNIEKYGTLQDIVEISEDEKLAKAEEEANLTIKEHGKTKIEYTVDAIDNPWVKKGNTIIYLGNMYEVDGIEHDATNHVMTVILSERKNTMQIK